jgi:hypothetical protein
MKVIPGQIRLPQECKSAENRAKPSLDTKEDGCDSAGDPRESFVPRDPCQELKLIPRFRSGC